MVGAVDVEDRDGPAVHLDQFLAARRAIRPRVATLTNVDMPWSCPSEDARSGGQSPLQRKPGSDARAEIERRVWKISSDSFSPVTLSAERARAIAARVTSALSRRSTPVRPRTRSIPRISGSPQRRPGRRAPGELFDRGAVQSLEQQRHKPAHRRGLDRRIGVKCRLGRRRARRTDRPATGIPRHDGPRPCGQPAARAEGGRLLAKSSKRSIRSCRSHPLRSVTIVSSAVGISSSRTAELRSSNSFQAPLAIGARTRLPHSVQDPS